MGLKYSDRFRYAFGYRVLFMRPRRSAGTGGWELRSGVALHRGIRMTVTTTNELRRTHDFDCKKQSVSVPHRATHANRVGRMIAVTVFALVPIAVHADGDPQAAGDRGVTDAPGAFDCGYRSPEYWQAAIAGAVASGEIPDPRNQVVPQVAPRTHAQGASDCVPSPTTADLFLFVDSTRVLRTNFSDGQLFNLMSQAANALVAEHGDNFDFIGFWVNFTPDHQLGAAFYLSIQNNVSGIGLGRFNFRTSFGLSGREIQGFVMMWNINSTLWAPGTVGASASYTRLVLGQEFEHRFAMFLPNLLDGRQLQGDNGSCGRGAHWNWKVDGQGSGMEIREWVGESPASFGGNCVGFAADLCFNPDIDPDNAVFSYTDLYLMGYVSAAEMDAGNSELRYMDDSRSCLSNYRGSISTFSSTDIIAAAGSRSPSSATAQKHFRTGWVMIHLPESTPTTTHLSKAAGILERHSLDWNLGTLGRGTMNNTFRATCSPELEWVPVSANVDHSIRSGEIIIPPGDSQVVLDLVVRRWNPDQVSSVRARVDSAGYTNGSTTALSPLSTPDASAGAFIDTDRTDYVFTGLGSTTKVDTASIDYSWSATLIPPPDGVTDPEEGRYVGSLVLEIPADAEGTFTIGFDADPNETFLLDDSGAKLADPVLLPVTITIAAGNTACIVAVEASCNDAVTFDDSGIINPPDPPFGCGFTGGPHEGAVWFEFTATDTSARISTCHSIEQDSTFAVYDGDCNALVEIGCGEDDGCGVDGFLSDQCVGGLTPGETYFIQISAWSPQDRGSYTMSIDCPCSAMQACCQADRTVCSDLPAGECAAVSGEAQGDGTVCLGDADSNGFDDACACPAAEAPAPEPGGVDKNRFLSIVPGNAGRMTALRVTFDSLDLFHEFDGEARWASEPVFCDDTDATPLVAAELGCEPFCADWGSIDLLHLFGAVVVPSSAYTVQAIDCECGFDSAANYSAPLVMNTGKWGDIVPPRAGEGSDQPDFTDLAALVDKFQGLPTAPSRTVCKLVPRVPNPCGGDVSGFVSFSDIGALVDAFTGRPYPFGPPDPCP